MKFVFVSNFLNHHQIPFSETLRSLVDEFYFVSTQSDQVQGYQVPSDAEYVVRYDSDDKCRAEELILSADVVIFGACPNELIEMRMRENKLSFLYTERFFKKGTWRRFIPRTHKAVHNRIAKYYNNKIYALCASAYLSYDLSFFDFPQDKCLKWGYFPATKTYQNIHEIMSQKQKASILWVGRLIDWKHPEAAILLAKHLKKMGYVFHLNIIGSGPLEAKLLELIKKEKLDDCIQMLGAMKPEQVRDHMEQSEIFLFTSDRYEGWGAVLNEAMNSGCAVVASHAIGSVPFLIENQKNGLIYQCGDKKDLTEKVKFLLENPKQRIALGEKAYQAMITQWNAENAAERFCNIARKLLNNDNSFYQNGVCSKAEIIKDNWVR